MTQLAGKKRTFGRGLGLSIITFGIYGLYWNYVARHEIYKQERREDFPTALFFLGFIPLVGLVFIVMYALQTQEKIQEARVARGLSPGVGGWEVVLWFLLPFVGAFVSYYKLQTSINEYWDAAATRSIATFTPSPPPAAPPLKPVG